MNAQPGAALLLAGGWLCWILLLSTTAWNGTITALALLCPPVLLLLAQRQLRAHAKALTNLRGALEPAAPDTASVLGKLEALDPIAGGLDAVRQDVHRLIDGAVATEEAIRASTTATTSILNSTQDAVLGIGPDGQCLFANRRAHELVGVPVGTLIGVSVHDAIHSRIIDVTSTGASGSAGSSIADCRFCSARAAVTPHSFYNETLRSADGALLDVDYQSFPVRSDAHSFSWVLTITDITERRSLERRYESLVATLPVGIYNLDLAGRLLFANDRFFDLVGVEQQRLIGQPLAQVLHPDDRSGVEQTLAQTVAQGAPFLLEHRIRGRDDEVLWVLSSGDVDRDQTGQIVGVNGIYTDISELKLAQAQLEELNATLESRIEQRTAELSAANKELNESMTQLMQTQDALIESERLAALGNLVAGLAHEINTPIGISKGAASHLAAVVADYQAQLQTRDANGQQAAKLAHALTESADLIQSNLSRAAALITRFKRVSVDQSYADERHFDLLGNINDAVAGFSRELAAQQITVDVHCDAKLEIWGDPGCYSQMHTIVLNNALDHAFRDAPEGTSRIVSIEAISQASGLTIIYGDNGRGVSNEVRQRMFEPFFTTGRHRGGTGLGLHILHLLVTRTLGGTVTCEDGKGLKLRIELPPG